MRKQFMAFLKKLFSTPQIKDKKWRKIQAALNYSGFTAQERLMIRSIVSIGDLIASDIMIPRVDVTRIQFNVNKKDLIQLMKTSLYSRFPVYGGNVDDIKGVLHIRDIFQLLLGSEKNFQIKKHLQDPIFVPETRPLLDILNDLQKEYKQMAIVMDEYGGFSGIITMEDIMEEIIGDIRDESDDKKEAIITQDHLQYSVDAREDLEAVNEKIQLNLTDPNADSLGGYVINLFGYIPKKGEKIEHQGVHYRIAAKRGNSITRIIINVSEELFHHLQESSPVDEINE